MPVTYPEPRISEEKERKELQSILDSGILKRAPNLQRFLEFVAEEYFAGNADQVKEYSIAVQALHRPEKFDPQSDTIVRVTAHALRKKLEQYYASEGASHDIQIQLPAGKYVLQFVPKVAEIPAEPVVTESESAPLITPVQEEASVWERTRKTRNVLWFGIAAAVLLLAIGIYFGAPGRAALPAKSAGPVETGGQNPVLRYRFSESGGTYLDAAGQSWISAQYCKGGTLFSHPSQDIQGTDDPALFREGRKGKFQCRIPAAPGEYQLMLLFADTTGDKVGAGQVDFSINDKPGGALDIVDEAGGGDIAVGKVYEGIQPMADGTIHLDFNSDDSFVNAAELTRYSSQGGLPLRMLAGPAAYRDESGNLWSPERFFQGGRRTSHPDTLPRIADAKLFGWERYGHFRYMLPVVPDREYTVRMYFYEGWFGVKNGGPGGVGSRVFDVYCNGAVLLDDFDITKEAGTGTTIATIHHVKPTPHGMLQIDFTPVKNYPLINAIEVMPEDK